MDNTVEKLDNINRTLERQNEIMQKMLDIMPGPESKFARILDTIVLIVGVMGILSTVEIVRHWIIGG